jgi:hypothetical protein
MPDAISYIRVSSDEQADSGLGLDVLRQRITPYCTMKGPPLSEVLEDAGMSAGKPLARRPAASKLLAALPQPVPFHFADALAAHPVLPACRRRRQRWVIVN